MSTQIIPSKSFGGTGQPLIFLHANGYPPECYLPFFECLTEQNELIAVLQRPLWDNSHPGKIRDWIPFSEDLLRYLRIQSNYIPSTIVGHSLGGTSALRAAIWEPDCFRALILLDPVLLPPRFILVWYLALKFNFAHRLHPHITTTLKRRRSFDDLDTVFKSYRSRSTFRFMSDHSLQAYIQGITESVPGNGYRLRYSPEWEAQVYYASIWRDLDIWKALPELTVPTLIIRGKETDTFWERTEKLVKRKQPKIQIKSVSNATHLVPLEKPEEVSTLIQSFLKEHL